MACSATTIALRSRCAEDAIVIGPTARCASWLQRSGSTSARANGQPALLRVTMGADRCRARCTWSGRGGGPRKTGMLRRHQRCAGLFRTPCRSHVRPRLYETEAGPAPMPDRPATIARLYRIETAIRGLDADVRGRRSSAAGHTAPSGDAARLQEEPLQPGQSSPRQSAARLPAAGLSRLLDDGRGQSRL